MSIKTHTTKKNVTIEYRVDDTEKAVEKCCLKCGSWKSLANYSNNSSCFLGLHNWCKECAKARAIALRSGQVKKPKKPVVIETAAGKARRCSNCGYIKKLDGEFDISPSGFLGHDSQCKECKRRKGELYRRDKGIRPQRKVPILTDASGNPTHRECARCQKMLSLVQYSKHAGGTAYLGIHPYCKDCAAERHLISKYGITSEDKARMHQEQNETCAICHEPIALADIHVDHCHATGKVRGLLCSACNKALGLLKDDQKRCMSMATYLSANAVADKHTK